MQDCSNSSAWSLKPPQFCTKPPIWTWQHTCRPTCVLISMAQRKTAATLVHQHWSYHSSTPKHWHEPGTICIEQPVYSHWWPSARLQQLQCVSTVATTVPRQAIINMTMAIDVQTNMCAHTDGPAQNLSNSSASALEPLQFSTKPPIWTWQHGSKCIKIKSDVEGPY